MGLRLRLNRLERKASKEAAHELEESRRDEQENMIQFYREHPEARHAAIAKALSKDRPRELRWEQMDPGTRRVLDTIERLQTATVTPRRSA